jgi:hypothetical protein
MEINSKDFIKIMNKNFGYDIVDTDIGKGIKIDKFNGFVYSSVTGAGYLDDYQYLFTPKGLMKLFYNALNYKFVTGLFDNTTLKNTPYIISRSKKYLFENDKIIIPVEFTTETELQSKLKRFISNISEPSTNFIIQRIEKSKNGNGMEPFMEYLACEAVKTDGLIVENQIPLSQSSGSPDFGGYRVGTESHFKNIHLIELSLIRLGWDVKHFRNNEKDYCVVGEAKTSTIQMKKQLDKYIKTKFFNDGFEIHPSKTISSDPKYGLITIDKNYSIKVIKKRSSETLFYNKNQKDYTKWLSNYVKYYLIANLTNDEFLKFYEEKKKKKLNKIDDVISFVNLLNYNEILNKIEEVSNGSIK